MRFIYLYLIAYILDLIIGDPIYKYHPIRIIGNIISKLEKVLYSLKNKKIGGLLLLISTIAIVFIFFYTVLYISKYISPILFETIQIFFLYTTLATRCLGDEGKKVYAILKKGGLDLAKKELSYLVTRDTKNMTEKEIIKSTVETISENSVDGSIAPIIFAFIGSYFHYKGIPLTLPMAMCYKAVNTLDSMVGYKNSQYYNFGYFSAKCDDILNFIPARIGGGFIIPLASVLLGYDYKSSLRVFLRDRKKHDSPNSGHPEAAFAGALGIQFGGKVNYFGEVVNKKKIGDEVKEFSLEDIKKSCNLLYVSSAVTILFILIIKVF